MSMCLIKMNVRDEGGKYDEIKVGNKRRSACSIHFPLSESVRGMEITIQFQSRTVCTKFQPLNCRERVILLSDTK
jgi:hypothetical protein